MSLQDSLNAEIQHLSLFFRSVPQNCIAFGDTQQPTAIEKNNWRLLAFLYLELRRFLGFHHRLELGIDPVCPSLSGKLIGATDLENLTISLICQSTRGLGWCWEKWTSHSIMRQRDQISRNDRAVAGVSLWETGL